MRLQAAREPSEAVIRVTSASAAALKLQRIQSVTLERAMTNSKTLVLRFALIAALLTVSAAAMAEIWAARHIDGYETLTRG